MEQRAISAGGCYRPWGRGPVLLHRAGGGVVRPRLFLMLTAEGSNRMAVNYFYSWDSIIGTFTICHRDDDYWELFLDGDFIIHTGSPSSCITMLKDGLDNVDWDEEDPNIPNLGKWAKIAL